MNYLQKFGLTFNPFLKSQDTRIETESFKQTLFRLKNFETTKGVGIVTGEPGLGKTTAVRYWSNALSSSLYKIVYIPNSTLTLREFYCNLAEKFNLEVSYSKRVNYRNIQAEIERLVMEKNVTPIIILDEANFLSSAIFNDLKMLLNFNMDSQDRLMLLLIGQTPLRNVLNLKANEALKQRITMNCSMTGYTKDECRYYIDTKLQAAGLIMPIMTDIAYNIVSATSNGVPRVINQIMDKCLLFMDNKKTEQITEEIVNKAIAEIMIC